MNTPPLPEYPMDDPFLAALLRGDRAAAQAAAGNTEHTDLIARKNRLLETLTRHVLAGEAPFCQLAAVAQAVSGWLHPPLPPVACCGAAAGNPSAAGKDYMLMLLDAWGVPALDLGTNVSPDAFADALLRYDLRFAVCALFAAEDAACVRALDAAAKAGGYRSRVLLAICGASFTGDDLPVDCPDYRAAATAQWVVNAWNS